MRSLSIAIFPVVSGFSRTCWICAVMSRASRTTLPQGPAKAGHYRIGFVGFLSLLISQTAAAQTPQNDVTVRASIDRTAVFVGDRITYTIDLTCRPGVDILADDLSRDKLRVEGLDFVGGDTDRRSAANGTTSYRFRYVLTPSGVDVPLLEIAPLTVRYAISRPGQPPEEASPAGEVQAPGASAAFRSALAEEEALTGIRSDKPSPSRARRFAFLQPIGLGLIIVSAVPASVALAGLARRARRPRRRRSKRTARHEERASLEAVRTLALDTIERRREAWTRIDALVRAHLRDACGVPADSLTPQEVPAALARSRTHVPVELVASVLAACEQGRYAPPPATPSAEACREAIGHAEQVLSFEF